MCCIFLLAVRIHTLFTNPLWLLCRSISPFR
ncbi:hypothetical protein [Bacteroides phage LoVEphage]|nr:hypothetical protein [Bacteroides phage LoVEphage]UBU95398.1 MAG: hypothetical protein [Bacteroides phage LoVEphage]UBU95464.1 MAG: hypothetical protein [Bacteroides phage LoVEphage]UBU95588.1 MAG: hypothetical protein [Bacteroides phage LoVEphage]UYE98338.1 MAG: hypothetical protein [Bacteroides phage R001]